MDLDKLIEQKIQESRLYGVTKPSIIKEILMIPDDINLKSLDKIIDKQALNILKKDGYIFENKNNIKVTEKGYFVLNYIINKLVGL